MTQANAILGLLAQTAIHAGTGQNTGVIDLPIQRESHTGYPCVFGSAMKGALRAHASNKMGDAGKESIKIIFGPDTNNASEHAGALMVSDARLLLLPIRSLTSQFKWVSCPDILQRFQRDCARFGIEHSAFTIPECDDDQTAEPTSTPDGDLFLEEYRFSAQAAVPTSTPDGDLFLEEYRFSAQAQDLSSLIQALATLMPRPEAAAQLEKQLVIVSNDMFAHLAQHATPVNAHIAIDTETKIVRNGALWYEETLPADTLLYSGLSAVKARNQGATMEASGVLNGVLSLFEDKPWLQVGGNETVGMGWCEVKAQQGA